MDENNNGPTAGIIGQDVPSDSQNTGGTIFDSSKFTGEQKNEQGLVLNQKTEKPKGQNPFTKWQFWAITSGVILLASAAAIVILCIIFDGRVKNAESVASYDLATNSANNVVGDFDKAFSDVLSDAYGTMTTSTTRVYPTEEEITKSKEQCLGRFGVDADDIEFVTTLKTGAELMSGGQNVAQAKERLDRTIASYTAATTSIAKCREDILAPVLKKFKIELGDLEVIESESNSSYVELSQIVKVTNNSGKDVSSISITFDIVDRNGVSVRTKTTTYYGYSDNKVFASGDTIEMDIYNSYSRHITTKESAKTEKSYKAVLKSVIASYAYTRY